MALAMSLYLTNTYRPEDNCGPKDLFEDLEFTQAHNTRDSTNCSSC